LRRTTCGEFSLADAQTLEALGSAVKSGRLEDICIHPRKLLPDFPSVTANDDMLARIRTGRTVNLPDMSRAPLVKVFYGQRELVCIASRVAGTLFHPRIVLTNVAPQLVNGAC
jgi:tRNA pseudouridine55 synthase